MMKIKKWRSGPIVVSLVVMMTLLGAVSLEARLRDEGLWMPVQMDAHADKLREMGLELDPLSLMDPTAFPLSAIIKLGNPRHVCSASFVSAEGLVGTNHHCVEGFLSFNSRLGRDLVTQGFLAKSKEEEILASPTARLFVTQSFRNVTEEVLQAASGIRDFSDRYEAIESKRSDLEASCNENTEEFITCEVKGFFEGSEFFEIQMLEIRDVRLVYAPEKQIGFYGGWDDNWRWPRHTGDYAFLRAYVGPDGQPADYAEDNIPYQPEHYLQVAGKPLEDGDFVMVTGYPGSTSLLKTAFEAQEAAIYSFPRRSKHFRSLIEILKEATKEDEEARYRVNPLIFGLTNAAQLYEGSVGNMVNRRLIADKYQLETEMRKWIAENPEAKAKYAGLFEELEKAQGLYLQNRSRDDFFRELTRSTFSTRLLSFAQDFGALFNETEENSMEKRAVFVNRLEEFYSSFEGIDLAVEYAKFELQLERLLKSPRTDWPQSFAREWDRVAFELGREDFTASEMGRFLFLSSSLTKRELAKSLLLMGTENVVTADPMIRFAMDLRKEEKEVQARQNEYNSRMTVLRPLYVSALRDYTNKLLYPDANSSLRITFGQVEGYKTEDQSYTPFSTLEELVGRHQDGTAFAVPEKIREAFEAKNFGPYASYEGQVPVDFLSNLHITGGNSGSATLNARGELVGFAFDSNYEGLGSDWKYNPDLTRSIHVDIRYTLWVMDAVDEADHLLKEMGLEPQID